MKQHAYMIEKYNPVGEKSHINYKKDTDDFIDKLLLGQIMKFPVAL